MKYTPGLLKVENVHLILKFKVCALSILVLVSPNKLIKVIDPFADQLVILKAKLWIGARAGLCDIACGAQVTPLP